MFLLPIAVSLALSHHGAAPPEDDVARLDEATRWIRSIPEEKKQFDYTMTAKLRLLLFWVGRDDVGGGYIRVGKEAGGLETLQVLFGSDPNRAPRRINRWGAATEVLRRSPEASALLGFMKSSKGSSVAEMEKELSSEKARGKHSFEAIVSRVDPARAVSRVVPFSSDVDFNLHELERARALVMDRLSTAPPSVRRWEDSSPSTCAQARGFLFAVQGLVDSVLERKPAPLTTCYLYNARPYRVTVESVETVRQESVSVKLQGQAQARTRLYRDLLRARFDVRNGQSGQHTRFEILVGTEGALRGVPVQIIHQPNWWFKVILNLT